MDDQNNKKDFSEFFERTTRREEQENEQERERQEIKQEDHNEHKQEVDNENRQEKTSYYYSYGPFKASHQDLEGMPSQLDDQSQVEVSVPKTVRPLGIQR